MDYLAGKKQVIFNKLPVSVEDTIAISLTRLSICLQAQVIHFPYINNNLISYCNPLRNLEPINNCRKVAEWTPPEEAVLRWNVNRAACGKPDLSGIGGALRNSNGVFLCMFLCPTKIKDSNDAQTHAILKALKLSLSYHHTRRVPIIIGSDSYNTVSWVQDVEYFSKSWQMWDSLYKIGKFASVLHLARFQQIFHEINFDC